MSLSDLSSDPLPLPEGVDTFLAWVDSLIEDEQYAFALETLVGIRDTVARTQRVTTGQKGAIHNIVAGAEEGQRKYEEARRHRRPSRRYENWYRNG